MRQTPGRSARPQRGQPGAAGPARPQKPRLTRATPRALPPPAQHRPLCHGAVDHPPPARADRDLMPRRLMRHVMQRRRGGAPAGTRPATLRGVTGDSLPARCNRGFPSCARRRRGSCGPAHVPPPPMGGDGGRRELRSAAQRSAALAGVPFQPLEQSPARQGGRVAGAAKRRGAALPSAERRRVFPCHRRCARAATLAWARLLLPPVTSRGALRGACWQWGGSRGLSSVALSLPVGHSFFLPFFSRSAAASPLTMASNWSPNAARENERCACSLACAPSSSATRCACARAWVGGVGWAA